MQYQTPNAVSPMPVQQPVQQIVGSDTSRMQEASGSMQEKFVAHVGQALPKLRESLEVTDWLSFRDTFRDLDDNLVNSVLQEHTIPLIDRLALIKMLKTLGSEDAPAFQHAAKMNELGDEIEHLRECEEQLENWRQFSGMHSMLEDFRKKGDTSHDINDISIGLMRGVEETMDQTVAGIQESGVVAALLLSFSIPLLVDPPDAIGDLDDWAWQKVMHLLGWGIMSAMGVAIILYGKIYSTAAGRAIRTADKLRMMLAGNAFSDTLILLYVMFVFLAVGLIGTLHPFAGTAWTVIITPTVGVSLLIAARLGQRFIDAGHVEYGWRLKAEERGDPWDDSFAFAVLKQRMNVGLKLKDNAKSVFSFKGTGASGLNAHGKKMLFE